MKLDKRLTIKSIVEEFYRKRNGLRKNLSYGVTTEVKLYKRIPLFIDYYTAWVDENGIFNLRDDVYGRDIMLMDSLSVNN